MALMVNKVFTLFDPATITASHSFLTNLVNNEWFRITALGWLLSKAQNAFSILDPFSRLLRYFYVETTHHQRAGDTYNWLLAFWRRHPKFMLKARKFAIENKGNEQQERRMGYGMNHHVIANDAPIAELMGESLELQEERLSIAYTPSDGESFWFWHRGTLFCLSMACHDVGSNGRIDMYGRPVNSKYNEITVWTFSRTRKPLIGLLLEAKSTFDSLNPSRLHIRRYDRQYEDWVDSAMRQKRPLSGIIMEESAKSKLLSDSTDFLKSERWYASRGIPWKRGYMLNGPPGTGKSSTITALASQHQLPVYLLPIGSSDMTDDSLARAFQGIPSRSIVVLEDIDVAMAKTRNLPTEEDAQKVDASTPATPRTPSTHKSGISLSALLNGVDGVGAGEGRIMVMTTNDMSSLDPALIRPGRIDLTFRFRRATSAQASQLFKLFYEDWAPDTDYATTSNVEPTSAENREVIAGLAKEWSAMVEDDAFSIASLQGMLLEHKTDPHGAIQHMPTWLSENRKAR